MVNSHTSTACSSPANDSVEKVIKNDSVRYKRKGYGLIMASIQTIAYFTLLPEFLNSIYPSLIAGWDHRWFVFLSISLVHMCSNVAYYTLSYFIYTAKSPFFDRYKAYDEPWPWESNPKEWRVLFKKSLGLFLVNNLLMAPLMTLGDVIVSGVSLRTSPEALPTIKDVILQLVFCMIVEDFCFYWGHRLLHHPKIYPYIHKVHHQYTQTISIANEYAHPIEFLVSNMIPSALGPKLLGKQMHIATFWIWINLRVGESVDGHCGYDFSWSPFRLLPLSGSGTYHAFHHSANVGNYCSLFTFWDTVFQTNREYWVWLSKRQKESQLNEVRNAYSHIQTKIQSDPAYQASKFDGLKKETENKDAKTHQKVE